MQHYHLNRAASGTQGLWCQNHNLILLGMSGTLGHHYCDVFRVTPFSRATQGDRQVWLAVSFCNYFTYCTVVSYCFLSDLVFYHRFITNQVNHCSRKYVWISELQGSTGNNGKIWKLAFGKSSLQE